jgi:hypothetical protein
MSFGNRLDRINTRADAIELFLEYGIPEMKRRMEAYKCTCPACIFIKEIFEEVSLSTERLEKLLERELALEALRV